MSINPIHRHTSCSCSTCLPEDDNREKKVQKQKDAGCDSPDKRSYLTKKNKIYWLQTWEKNNRQEKKQ